MVRKNHNKCVFLFEMTRHTEILISCVCKWAIKVEFRWLRFIQMDQIVHFDCQSWISFGLKVKISLCMESWFLMTCHVPFWRRRVHDQIDSIKGGNKTCRKKKVYEYTSIGWYFVVWYLYILKLMMQLNLNVQNGCQKHRRWCVECLRKRVKFDLETDSNNLD